MNLRTFITKLGTAGAALLIIIGAFSVASIVTTGSLKARNRVSDQAHKSLGIPYIHLGDHKPVSNVHQGEVFYVWNKYEKPELCRVIVTNLLIDKERHIAYHYSMFANWFNEGIYEFNEFFVMPDKLPPGNYHLIKKSSSFCNGLETYTTNFDLPVTVLPK